MQVVLAHEGEAADVHHPVAAGGERLLGHLQADVRADRRSGADQRPLLADGDRSLRIHACHGRARQVEVLRDAILHLLQADPTLEPRDVIVMCPDIETFAPLIHATFGAAHVAGGDDPDRPDLHVRLADRSLRQTNPVLGLIAQLLDIADGRLTASQVLDLADRDVVRRRFGLDDDDLARLEDWVGDAGIRWGLDAEHRRPFRLDVLPAGTWRAGLDRLLAGVTMSEDGQRLIAGHVLPLDDVDSGSIELAGRFAELVDRLGDAVDRLTAPPDDRRLGGHAGRGRRRAVASPRRPSRGRRPSCAACWTTSSARPPSTGSPIPPSSSCPRCARCWPTACRAARRAPTSAPAT